MPIKIVKWIIQMGMRWQRFLARTFSAKGGIIPLMAKVVPRSEWGAEPARERQTQESVAKTMVITWTETEPCQTPDACQKVVKDLQRQHMEAGEPDIKYNFLIGGDGKLYEGRGWGVESSYPKIDRADEFEGNSVQVALISKPTYKPTYVMLKAIASLFAIGEEDKHVAKNMKYARIMENRVLIFSL